MTSSNAATHWHYFPLYFAQWCIYTTLRYGRAVTKPRKGQVCRDISAL
jgi:hypothetical protein